MNLLGMINEMRDLGYTPDEAEARVCQDIVLKAIASSSLSGNVTIKGGVVMRSMTNDIRRATIDLDIDFIRYSMTNESLMRFIDKINCLDGISIKTRGKIEDLNHQDYKGKRVYISISDKWGNSINSKIDFGVHDHLEIEQEEYCFDIAFDNMGASLLVNSREQMFAEKLRSLLKLGSFSTRYKDIFDMYYQCGKINLDKLSQSFRVYIIDDPNMRENTKAEIVNRVREVFASDSFRRKVDESDKRWMDDDIDKIFKTILNCLDSVEI